jgi:PPOX class probable F420-dependent enzyme
MSATVPPTHKDLLERPLFGHLATVRPDGTPQVNVMWFLWDDERLKFTHTTYRQKFRNLKENPAIAMSIADPDDGYRFLEVRGVVESIEPDPTGAFYRVLDKRYHERGWVDVKDAADRVILVVRPTKFVAH